MLTRKSSISRTFRPPRKVRPLHTLYPRTQGILVTSTSTKLTIVDFLRLHPKLSMAEDIRFSKTAITVVKLAKVINRKNNAPQILPPAIFTKTFGSVTKIREGPESGCTPKEKQAGKMIRPDISATKVSRPQIRTASPGRVCLSDI